MSTTSRKNDREFTVTGRAGKVSVPVETELRSLIGKKCWKAAFSYGGDLRLHIGGRVSYGIPQMAGKKKGEWVFSTCATQWVIVSHEHSMQSVGHTQAVLEEQAKNLEARRITGISATRQGMCAIAFSGNWTLIVLPNASDKKYKVPYWELFMPQDKVIICGPGDQWAVKSANAISDV